MLLLRLGRASLQKRLFINTKLPENVARCITTSKKNSDSTSGNTAVECPTSGTKSQNPNWQTYGFALNEKEDKAHMHLSFFFGVTMSIVVIAFYVAYVPREFDWQQREAFLELRRRELEGLPLVDPNYIDPSLIELPSEEELGDTEIII